MSIFKARRLKNKHCSEMKGWKMQEKMFGQHLEKKIINMFEGKTLIRNAFDMKTCSGLLS